MFTTGSKWFFGLGLVSLVLAFAYGWTTGGSGLGPLTVGYKGGVGDHLGYGVLVAIATVAAGLGVLAVATRDADPDAVAQLAGVEPAPATSRTAASYWPIVGVFGVGLVAVGLVVSNVLFVAGLAVCAAVLVEWAVLAWSDRATGDPVVNRALRDRLLSPLEVPLAGVLSIGIVVVGFSRVFLTSSKLGAVWVACALAAVVFVVGALLATRPKVSPNLVAGLLVVGAVATIAGGIAAGSRGERHFHSIAEERAEEGAEPHVRLHFPGAAGMGEDNDRDEAPTPPTTVAEEGGS